MNDSGPKKLVIARYETITNYAIRLCIAVRLFFLLVMTIRLIFGLVKNTRVSWFDGPHHDSPNFPYLGVVIIIFL